MNWAKEESARIINSEGFRDTPADVIAAALQSVADECAKIAAFRSREFEMLRDLPLSSGAHAVANAIRARFPREGA